MSNLDITILFVLAVVFGVFALGFGLIGDAPFGLACVAVCAALLKVMIAGAQRS
jgi:hypothetical protein